MTEPEIRDELANSRKRLISEKAVDPVFIPFSYPNGNYTDRIAKMVRDAGYDLAVTTENGWNHNRSDLFALKRISVFYSSGHDINRSHVGLSNPRNILSRRNQ